MVAGGYRGDGATVSTVEILDIGSGRWEPGPDLPVPVNHAMSATVGDRIYVFGGYLSSNRPTDVAFTLDGGQWRQVASLPQPRAAGTAVALGDTVYVAGGIGPNGLAAEMLVYDAAADRWSTAPGPPTRREHLGGAGFGGIVYTVGGRTGGLDTNLAAFEAYDPRTSAWTRLPGSADPARRPGRDRDMHRPDRRDRRRGDAIRSPQPRRSKLQRGPGKHSRRYRRRGTGSASWRSRIRSYTLSGGPEPGLHVADTTEAIEVAGRCQ